MYESPVTHLSTLLINSKLESIVLLVILDGSTYHKAPSIKWTLSEVQGLDDYMHVGQRSEENRKLGRCQWAFSYCHSHRTELSAENRINCQITVTRLWNSKRKIIWIKF